MRAAALPALVPLLAACASGSNPIGTYQPPGGVHEVLRGPIESAPGRELVIGDLVLASEQPIARHYHSGEEFLYVIGGAATLSRPGQPDLVLGPGDSVRIPARTVHWGRSGPGGLRAISSWVAARGEPLRVPVE